MIKPKPIFIAWNCHNLSASRLNALQLFASQTRPLAISLTEIRLSPNSRAPKIAGYSTYFKPVSRSSCGSLMFVADCFLGTPVSHRRREELECSAHFLCVEVKFAWRSASLLLASVYHHRTESSLAGSAWIKLKKSLSCLSRSCSDFICAGDFNCHDNSWNTVRQDSFGADLASFCSDHSITVLNSIFCPGQPTFPSSGSVIDLALCSSPSLVSEMLPLHDSPLDSDHFPL